MSLMRAFFSSLKELGISLPKHVYAFEHKDGIRVASKSLMNAPLKGIKGILAYTKNGFTHSFILTFGSLASKVINVDSVALANGEPISVEANDGIYVAMYKGFPLALVEVKKGKAYPRISRGFRRAIINRLKG